MVRISSPAPQLTGAWPPAEGHRRVDANPYLSRHRLPSNNSQNKKLFSDNAMGAFHRDT